MEFVKIKKQKLIQAVRNMHRLFGFFLSLLFFVWCTTGFVMMYKEFPSVSKTEYLKMRTNISYDSTIKLSAINEWEYTNLDSCSEIRMYQLLKKKIINIVNTEGKIICLDAYTGKYVNPIKEHELKDLVNSYFGNTKKVKTIDVITELDQWIPRTKFLPHMPIYKVLLDDKENTTCYISSQSGEIIQKLNFEDKIWAWLGPIPHWIYFKNLRINTDAWRYVVITLSSLGVVLALLGIILGVSRTVNSKNKSQKFSPYKKKWFRWHHYVGFIFGLFIFTWILSGLLSMNPLKWASEDSLSEKETKIWQGTNYSILTTVNNFQSAFDNITKHKSIKEIKFSLFNSDNYLIATNQNNEVQHVKIQDKNVFNNAIDILSIKSQVLKLLPNNKIIASEILTDYDNYYYNKHRTLPLPIYRFKFDDKNSTWYYVNPKTLTVVKKMQTDNKIERWLYNGLHSLDFPQLFYKRPLWDIIVIVLLLGCTLLSFTGLKLTAGWFFRWYNKRLIRK